MQQPTPTRQPPTQQLWELAAFKKQELWEVKDGVLRINLHEGQERAYFSEKPIVFVCAGSQSGKCQVKSARILFASGERVQAKDVRPGDQILSLDPKTLKIVPARVLVSQSNGVKPTFRLTTRGGRENVVSGNHPFLTKDGWIDAASLLPGDKIAVPRVLPVDPQGEDIDENWAKILGYLVADGSLRDKTPAFCDTDPETLADLASALPSGYELRGGENHNWRITEGKGRTENIVRSFVRRCGIDTLSKDKSLPSFVFTLRPPLVAIVLRSMFSCDGWVDTSGVGYCSASETLARQVQHLLLRFGIPAKLRSRMAKCQTGTFLSWDLQINALKFLEVYAGQIGFVGHNAPKLTALLAKKRENTREFDSKDVVPGFPIRECYAQLRKQRIGKANTYAGDDRRRHAMLRRFRQQNVEREGAQMLAEEFGVGKELAYSDIYWDTVESVEPAGEEEVWDLEVEGTHTLIADDIISHNTSFGPVWLLSRIKKFGPGDYLVIGPTYPLMEKKVIFETLRFLDETLRLGKYRASIRVFEISKYGQQVLFGHTVSAPTRIHFCSAENPNSLESATANAIWFDEAAQDEVKYAAWEAAERRVATTRSWGAGQILITSTPYVMNWIHRLLYLPAEQALARGQEHPFIDLIQFASTMNPNFSQEEMEYKRQTMPSWRFSMMHLGQYVRPAGMIYQDFKDTPMAQGGHLFPANMPIPYEWGVRPLGVDFGAVNTAVIWLAQEPLPKDAPPKALPRLFLYRAIKLAGYTSQEFARHVLNQGQGEPPVRAFGGAPGETQQRKDWTAGGLAVREPPISDVESQIDHVIAHFKTGALYIRDDLDELLDEIMRYRRKLDDLMEPTEEIQNKKAFHYMDAMRYGVTGATYRRSLKPVSEALGRQFAWWGRG
jgi:intein/homing endonuclease